MSLANFSCDKEQNKGIGRSEAHPRLDQTECHRCPFLSSLSLKKAQTTPDPPDSICLASLACNLLSKSLRRQIASSCLPILTELKLARPLALSSFSAPKFSGFRWALQDVKADSKAAQAYVEWVSLAFNAV